MHSVAYNPHRANFDNRKLKMRVEAQGGLFAIALESELPKSTNESCASDVKLQRKIAAKLWQRYQLDFSFEEIAFALAGKDMQTDTSMEQDDIGFAVISDEAREQIAREVCLATLREIHDKPKRKMIASFSRKSRLRLLKLVARMDARASGLFLTFTYRANMQDHSQAKAHLDLMLRWLKNNYAEGAYLWRMEYQERGAIHFHIIAFNLKHIDIKAVTKHWQKITGDDSYPDVETLHNRRKAMYYVSKYVAKPESAGFINEPYLEKQQFVGRFWGVVNRKLLPFATRTFMLLDADAKIFHDMRRYGRKHYKRLSRRLQGFCLLVSDANQWLDLMWSTEQQTGRVSGLRQRNC